MSNLETENSQSRLENEINKTAQEITMGLQIDPFLSDNVSTCSSEDSNFYDDYWRDDEFDIRAEFTGLPKQGNEFKRGKVTEKRGSNQEKFSSPRLKTLVKYGNRDVPALGNEIDEDTKVVIKEMLKKHCSSPIVNDVVRSTEKSVLIHCYSELDNCTGKPQEYLVKVYRLQYGLPKIEDWASKEYWHSLFMRRLVHVPIVYSPTKNMVILRFIGDNGVPAPSLQDLEVTEKMYKDVIESLYKSYNKANIVLGNLCAKNILWWRDKVWFISLSASVRVTHPNALIILLKDCCNITRFFKSKGLKRVKSVMNLFYYITGLHKVDGSVLHILRNTRKPVKNRRKKKQPHEKLGDQH